MSKFEITNTKDLSVKVATSKVSEHYYDKLLYKGIEFFNSVYMNTICEYTFEKLRIGHYNDVEEELYDEENNEYYTEISQEEIWGQECYLGYVPELDMFINAYDMSDDCVGTVFLKVNEKLEVTYVEPSVNHYGLFYSNGGYKKIKAKFPNIIDIRVD